MTRNEWPGATPLPQDEHVAIQILQGQFDSQHVIDRILQELAQCDPYQALPRSLETMLTALAAVEPSNLTSEIGKALAAFVRRSDLTATWQPGLDSVFQLLPVLLPSPAIHELVDLSAETLCVPDVHPRWSRCAAELLCQSVQWQRNQLGVERVIEIFEGSPARERESLLISLVEPVMLSDPGAIRLPHLDHVCRLVGDPVRVRYLLAALAEHDRTPQDVADSARSHNATLFPLRRAMTELFGRRGLNVLCVQNIADAQGDEIIRTAPLLQALLDAHPDTRVTLVTDRSYLYGHDRIETVSFDDHSRIESAFSESPDVLIDFFESRIRHLNHDTDMPTALTALRSAKQPILDIRGHKGWDGFHFDVVWLGGLDWARALGLNRPRHQSVYDPAFRLIMELGLPLCLGEDPPRSGPVLVNRSWSEFEGSWQETVCANTEDRPVALVNPCGGAGPLKGFVPEKHEDLIELLIQLIDDRYYVVLTPTGTPWGSAEVLAGIRVRLPESLQSFVGIAPDPGIKTEYFEREDQADAANRDPSVGMRQLITFVDRASLIVTVEGWMMHAAYLFGKPYRLLMLSESHHPRWQPWGTGAQQESWLFKGNSALDHPPLPEQPRKWAWLRLLSMAQGVDWFAYIDESTRSPDRDIRICAVSALGHIQSRAAFARLTECLNDPSHRVRGAAATALLDHYRDELVVGGSTDPDRLEAFRQIGHTPPRWHTLGDLDPSAALPALEVALQGDDPVVRREAAEILEHLSRRNDGWDVNPQKDESVGRLYRSIALGKGVGRLMQRVVRRAAQSTDTVASEPGPGTVLILTPLKDAADCIEGYCWLLRRLAYPRQKISMGFLESDSTDDTYEIVRGACASLSQEFRRVELWKQDFGYQLPPGMHRGTAAIQDERRRVLARSRNHLLSHALKDEEWVLWMDVDLVEYPPDVIERLLAIEQNVVHPHCVLEYGGPTFDQNAWRDQGRLHLDDLRSEGDLVPLDTVGGTMLLVRADLHRDGLIFPATPYRPGHPKARRGQGELETEGFGILASDFGETCWGLPNLEILHRRA